jgi:tetratricopeptide (TPR) repeat protein
MGESGRGVSSLVVQLCGPDASCRAALAGEVKAQSVYFGAQAQAGLGVFRSLLEKLGGLPGRKTVVLASAGILASDRPGARPDLQDVAMELGRVAGQHDIAIYTLFMDQKWLEQSAAETQKANSTLNDLSRDSAVLGRWLDQFSGTAGGALIKVVFGNSEVAFDRILNETSAYYLVGVQPMADDYDGRSHELNVKVSQPNATVRGRAWLTLPAAVVPGAPADRPRSLPVEGASAVGAVGPHAPSGALVPLAAAFERGDDMAVLGGAMTSPDLPRLIRNYRAARPFWAGPWRDAVFALDLALGGLRGVDETSQQEAATLLIESNRLIRQSGAADAFECQWHVVQAAAFEGLWRPATTLSLIAQAKLRCPRAPHLALAHAVIAEQQFPPGPAANLPGEPVPADAAAREREILPLYEAAMAFPEIADEARARAAWLLLRAGRPDRARTLLDQIRAAPRDLKTRYLIGLIRGEVLRVQNHTGEAAAAFRDAMAAYPGAQSARIALMTLLVATGDRQQAEALALEVATAPSDSFDPWWAYSLGEFRNLPALLADLRGTVR